MHNSALPIPNNNLAFVITRLTALRLAIVCLLLLLLIYINTYHSKVTLAAWIAVSCYLPLLAFGLYHSRNGMQPIHLVMHLLFECQVLTIFLFFTGGASNPLISYLLILIVFAAYNLSRLWVWLVALTCILDYSILTQFYQPLSLNISSHHLANQTDQQSFLDWHLAGMWLTFLVSTIILTLLVPALMQSTIRKRQQLAELREKQLKNEQLIGIATLAAGTAHEMGTPLMMMEMILNNCIEDQTALNQKDTELLHQQVMICRQALQRLALAGRNIHNEAVPVNAHQWLTALLHRWRLSQPNALWLNCGLEQYADLPKSPLLDQALLNLLDNAAQAGSETIELSSEVIDKHWLLTIHQPDTQAAKHLQQHHLFSSNKKHGIGLGLYLSNASIEQFDGQVHLSANQDGSTSCIIRLPCIGDGE
jgi:two-component system sensor histidine kinase RegB